MTKTVSFKVHFSRTSSNSKTGPIPVSTTSAVTCPDACGVKGKGCYAESGRLAMHWRAVTKGLRGMGWTEFCLEISKLPKGILWRHNQAGDLPGVGDALDTAKLSALVKANKGRRGFTYTHKPLTGLALKAVKAANAAGFTINASADTVTQADVLAAKGLPTVVVLPHDAPRGMTTPAGRVIAICPAQLTEHITCEHCQLCSKADRSYIIGFRAHGRSFKQAERLSQEDLQRRAAVKAAAYAHRISA